MLKLLDASTKIRKDVSIIVLSIENSKIVEFLNHLETELENNRILQIAKSENRISLICDDPLALRLSKEKKRNVVNYRKDLAAITMTSPEKAVDTPGILAYILNQFAKNSINVYEIISCHNDVSFIIDRDKAIKTRELLGKFL